MTSPVLLHADDEENRRRCFRVEVDQSVKVMVNGEPVDVLDISSTGIAFRLNDVHAPDVCYMAIEFSLRKKYRIKPNLKILFCRNDRCGAEFVELPEKFQIALSELVVSLQKRAIQRLQEERAQQLDPA